ncbi:MAG: 50S ribosomal protein L9 [Pseudomonadota bacterium]
MHVILLERVEKLGQMGDVVTVKDGYARNFLLPKKKALRATEQNKKFFEAQRAELEARNLERKGEAEQVAEKLDGQSFIIIRQASDMGQLYGSVNTRDIAEAAEGVGVHVARTQVVLDKPLKNLGLEDVRIRLHPEVSVTVSINIARSEEEAELQAKGEDIAELRAAEEAEEIAASAADLLEDEDEAAALEASEDADETAAKEEDKDAS